MIYRMRKSALIVSRSYLKYYTNPNTLAMVKTEPTAELVNRAKSGRMDNPFIVKQEEYLREQYNYNVIADNPIPRPLNSLMPTNEIPAMLINGRRKLNSKL